jgi:hypothetical protein
VLNDLANDKHIGPSCFIGRCNALRHGAEELSESKENGGDDDDDDDDDDLA